MESRRRFMRNCALGAVGVASIVNTNCDCDSCVDPERELIFAYLGFFGDKDNSRAWREKNAKPCEDERRRDQPAPNPLQQLTPIMFPTPTFAPFIATINTETETFADYSGTFARGAVMTGRTRLWILDDYGNPRVRVVDAQTLRLLTDLTIPGALRSRGIARSPDASAVYVNRGMGTPSGQSGALPAAVFAINAANNAITQFVEIPGNEQPETLSASPDGRFLAITSVVPGPVERRSIFIVDVAARRISGTISVAQLPGRLVFTPDGTLAFGRAGNSVLVIDVASATVVRTVSVLGTGGDLLAVSPTGDRLYVAGAYVQPFTSITVARTGIAILDTSSLEVVGYVPYSDPGKIRDVVAFTTDPQSGLLFLSFYREPGYYSVNPAYRQMDAFYKPTPQTPTEITIILAEAF